MHNSAEFMTKEQYDYEMDIFNALRKGNDDKASLEVCETHPSSFATK